MFLYEIVELIGFLLGTTLHAALLGSMIRRKRARQDIVFLGLVVSVLMWHAGWFATLSARVITGERITFPVDIFGLVAAMGMLLMPTLLVHTLIVFFLQRRGRMRRRQYHGMLLAIYLPMVPGAWFVIWTTLTRSAQELTTRRVYTVPFAFWSAACLVLSIYLCRRIARRAKSEDEKSFFDLLGHVFIGMMVLGGATHVLGFRLIPYVGVYLGIATKLSSLLPTLLFSYYVLRYNILNMVMKRSLVLSMVAVIFISIYCFGVRPLGDYIQQVYDFNFSAVEAFIVIVLAFLYRPMSDALGFVFDKLVFKVNILSRERIGALSEDIASKVTSDESDLLDYIAESLAAAIGAEHVAIVMRDHGPTWTGTATVDIEEISDIVSHFSDRKRRCIFIDDLAEPTIPHRQDLDVVAGEIDRLSHSLTQLLAFAKPDSALDDETSVTDVVEGNTVVLHHMASQQNVELEVSLDDYARVLVLGHASGAVREICFNLMLNAIEAMPDGGCLTVTASRGDAQSLTLVVRDTGPGVPDENRQLIFEPFYTTKREGTGLGLANVEKRVDELGGTISVESDGGSVFTVVLPSSAFEALPNGEQTDGTTGDSDR